MKGGTRPLGYTIIEVMIVLAVSGVMFLLASNFISGKQERATFTSGVNDMASKIQNTIGQVTDGKYSDISINCTHVSGNTNPNLPLGSNTEQGTNAQCVFLGKIMHFSKDSPKYNIFYLAGGRVDDNNDVIVSLSNSNPATIDSLTTEHTIPQGLDVNKITLVADTGATLTSIYGLGFLQGLGTANSSGIGLQNGSQHVSMYYVPGLISGQSKTDARSQINASPPLLARSANICLTDNKQYADIVIDTKSNHFSVDVTMHGTLPC